MAIHMSFHKNMYNAYKMRKHLDRAQMYEKMGNVHKARQHRARARELQMNLVRSSYAFGGDESFLTKVGNFFRPKPQDPKGEDDSSIRERQRGEIMEQLRRRPRRMRCAAEADVNEAKIGELQGKIGELEGLLEAKKVEHEAYTKEHGVCKDKVEQNLIELSECKTTRAKLEAEIEKFQSKLTISEEALNTHQAGHKESKGQVEKHLADLSQCKDEMTAAIKQLKSQLASSEADLSEHKQNSEEMANQIKALNAQLKVAKTQAQKVEGLPPPPPSKAASNPEPAHQNLLAQIRTSGNSQLKPVTKPVTKPPPAPQRAGSAPLPNPKPAQKVSEDLLAQITSGNNNLRPVTKPVTKPVTAEEPVDMSTKTVNNTFDITKALADGVPKLRKVSELPPQEQPPQELPPQPAPKPARPTLFDTIRDGIFHIGKNSGEVGEEDDAASPPDDWDFGRIMAFGSSRMKSLKVELAVVNDVMRQVNEEIRRVLNEVEKCRVVTQKTITYVSEHMQNVLILEKQLEEINREINAEKDRSTIKQMSKLV